MPLQKHSPEPSNSNSSGGGPRSTPGAAWSKNRATEFKRMAFDEMFESGQVASYSRWGEDQQPRDVYKIGTIFSVPHHSQASQDSHLLVDYDDPHVSATAFGPVYSKYRRMIVVETYTTHCTCVPIYTHNGRGLAFKSAELRRECVSIRDATKSATGHRPSETENGLLIAYRRADVDLGSAAAGSAGNWIDDRSSVHFCEVVSHRYTDRALIEGRLNYESMALLQKLVAESRSIGCLTEGQVHMLMVTKRDLEEGEILEMPPMDIWGREPKASEMQEEADAQMLRLANNYKGFMLDMSKLMPCDKGVYQA